MNEAARARYDEVVEIYGWLGAFTPTLDPERDEDLQADLFYVDSVVAGWIAPGQFEKAQVPGPVLEYVNSIWPHHGGLSWPHRLGCGRGGSWWCRSR